MWCRAIFTIVAISCAFSSEIISQDGRLGELKGFKLWCLTFIPIVYLSYTDIICMLLLHGVKKEDLDAITLDKLQRHYVNIDDLNNEESRQECRINTNKHIQQNEFYTEQQKIYEDILLGTTTNKPDTSKETRRNRLHNIAQFWKTIANDAHATSVTDPTTTISYHEQYINRLFNEYLSNLSVTTQHTPTVEDIVSQKLNEVMKEKYKGIALEISDGKEVKDIIDVEGIVSKFNRRNQKSESHDNNKHDVINNEHHINISKYNEKFKEIVTKDFKGILKDELGRQQKEIVQGFIERLKPHITNVLNTQTSNKYHHNNSSNDKPKPLSLRDILSNNNKKRPPLEEHSITYGKKDYYSHPLQDIRHFTEKPPVQNLYYKAKEKNLHVNNALYPSKRADHITKDNSSSHLINNEMVTKISQDELLMHRGIVKDIAEAVKNAVLKDMKKSMLKLETTSVFENKVEHTTMTYTAEKVNTTIPERKEMNQMIYQLQQLYDEFKTIEEKEMASDKPLKVTLKIDNDPNDSKKDSKMGMNIQTGDDDTEQILLNSKSHSVFQYPPDDKQAEQKALMIPTYAREIQPIILPLAVTCNTNGNELIVNTSKTKTQKHKEERDCKQCNKEQFSETIKTLDLKHTTHKPYLMVNKTMDFNILNKISSTKRPKYDFHSRRQLSNLKDSHKDQRHSRQFNDHKERYRDLLDFSGKYPRHHYANYAPLYKTHETEYKDNWRNFKYDGRYPASTRIVEDAPKYMENRHLRARQDARPNLELLKVSTYRGLDLVPYEYKNYLPQRIEEPKYSEILENIEKIPFSDHDKYFSREMIPVYIPPREQLPLVKAKNSGVEESYRKFMQTQEKINDLLRSMISRKRSRINDK